MLVIHMLGICFTSYELRIPHRGELIWQLSELRYKTEGQNLQNYL